MLQYKHLPEVVYSVQKYIDLCLWNYISKYTVNYHKRKYPLFDTAFDRRCLNEGNYTKAYIHTSTYLMDSNSIYMELK